MAKDTRLSELNKMLRSYGIQCYTWSPGDGQTRYRFSEDLDSIYSDCREIATVLGAGNADLFATAWIRGYQACLDFTLRIGPKMVVRKIYSEED